MKQLLNEQHHTDVDGNPAGGMTQGIGIDIRWQNGPLSVDGVRREPTGAFVEGVLEAAAGRLRFYQGSKFACEENAIALGFVEAAIDALEARTRDREERGVEGTHSL